MKHLTKDGVDLANSTDSVDLFISHAGPDKNLLVNPFAAWLGKLDVSYWLDVDEMRLGYDISQVLTESLQRARYVVVFLTQNFIGRAYPEAELRIAVEREKREARNIILPVISGDHESILNRYTDLKGRNFIQWEDYGAEQVARKCYQVLTNTNGLAPVEMPIAYTDSGAIFKPEKLLEFLAGLDYSRFYISDFICRKLRECGIHATTDDEKSGITVNGLFVIRDEPGECGWGEGGIGPYRLAYSLFELFSHGQSPTTTTFAGMGKNYRTLLKEFRSVIAAKIEGDGWNSIPGALEEDAHEAISDLRKLVEHWCVNNRTRQLLGNARRCFNNDTSFLLMAAQLLAAKVDRRLNIGRLIRLIGIQSYARSVISANQEQYDRYLEDPQTAGVYRLHYIRQMVLGLGGLPGLEFEDLYQELQTQQSREAKFCVTLESILDLLVNFHTSGEAWMKEGRRLESVVKDCERIREWNPMVWKNIEHIVERAISSGWLANHDGAGQQ